MPRAATDIAVNIHLAQAEQKSLFYFSWLHAMPARPKQIAKRELVKLINSLAQKYGAGVHTTRESDEDGKEDGLCGRNGSEIAEEANLPHASELT